MTEVTDFTKLNKDELIARLEEAEAVKKEQAEQINKLHAQSEGWLIQAPNPVYDGKVYGVQFINGQAFIPKSKVVAYFDRPPVKESTIKQELAGRNIIDPEEVKKEIAAVREREEGGSARRAAEALRDEFGYEIKFFSMDEQSDLKEQTNARAMERAQTEAAMAAAAEAQRMVKPGYVGG